MITHPRADQLAKAVSDWIDQIRPSLDPRHAFLARVAVNALATVERELSLGVDFEAAATKRLSALLKRQGGHGPGPGRGNAAPRRQRRRSASAGPRAP